AFGIVWCVFFLRWFRDDPADHPSLNAAERELLKEVESLALSHGDVPWKKLVSSGSVLLLWLQYFCFSYVWYFYITWLPTYLKDGRGVEMTKGALLAGLPLFFGGIGSMFSGWLAAWLVRHRYDLARIRRRLACVGFIGAAGMLVLS